MGEYRFGERRKPHRFCRGCGVSVMVGFGESGFVEERGLVAVNVGSRVACDHSVVYSG